MCAGFATVTLGGAKALAIGNVADLQSTDSLLGPYGPGSPSLIWGSTEVWLRQFAERGTTSPNQVVLVVIGS